MTKKSARHSGGDADGGSFTREMPAVVSGRWGRSRSGEEDSGGVRGQVGEMGCGGGLRCEAREDTDVDWIEG